MLDDLDNRGSRPQTSQRTARVPSRTTSGREQPINSTALVSPRIVQEISQRRTSGPVRRISRTVPTSPLIVQDSQQQTSVRVRRTLRNRIDLRLMRRIGLAQHHRRMIVHRPLNRNPAVQRLIVRQRQNRITSQLSPKRLVLRRTDLRNRLRTTVRQHSRIALSPNRPSQRHNRIVLSQNRPSQRLNRKRLHRLSMHRSALRHRQRQSQRRLQRSTRRSTLHRLRRSRRLLLRIRQPRHRSSRKKRKRIRRSLLSARAQDVRKLKGIPMVRDAFFMDRLSWL